jgi:hypothetical protein
MDLLTGVEVADRGERDSSVAGNATLVWSDVTLRASALPILALRFLECVLASSATSGRGAASLCLLARSLAKRPEMIAASSSGGGLKVLDGLG